MDKIGKSFSWSFFDKVTTQVISLAVSVVLARLIDPWHYGIIALAAIVVEIFDAFVNPGICSALVQKKETDSLDYDSMFVFNSIVGIILFFLVCVVSDGIEQFYKIDKLSIVIRVLALKIPFASFGSIQVAFVQKNFLYRRYFWVSLFGTLVAGCAGVILAYKGFGVWALVVNSLGNTIIDTLLAVFFIPWRPSFRFSEKRFNQLFSFGQKIFFVKLIDLGYERISNLIIGKKYTSSDLACNDKGQRFPQLIVNNIIRPMSEVLFPSFSSIQDDKKRTTSIFMLASSVSSCILFPVLFGFFTCADTFVSVVLTEKWIECVPYLRVTCINLLTIPVCTVIHQAIKAQGKGSLLLKMEMIKKMVGFFFVICSVAWGKGPLYLVIAMAVAAYFAFIVDLILARKHLGISIRLHLRSITKILISCFIMSVCVFFVGIFDLVPILRLFIQFLTGVFVYILSSYCLRTGPFLYIFMLLQGKSYDFHQN